jgi:5-methylcytosine-specific restriction protein B
MLGIYNLLKQFLAQAETENLKTSNYPKSFEEIKINVSFGQGYPARIPWISFTIEPNTTSNGIYPVYLYYKSIDKLILAYGISETTKPNINWNLNNQKTIIEFFKEEDFDKPIRYGSSYLFACYDIADLNEKELERDLASIIKYYRDLVIKGNEIKTTIFNEIILSNLNNCGLIFQDKILMRFTSSLLTKPFVILTGLSGSGKTKLAQAFAMWMSENKEQYALVPVGADWTNREPLMGYPNSLKGNHYAKPDTGVLDILLRAHKNYLANEKDLAKCTPFFLILDEMNLSHVERYFADFLSTMESGDEIKLYSGSQRCAELDADGNAILGTEIPDNIILPKNLFIIGTVNIDETTYMFSPKVLDRANTIEFRITPEEMEVFYQNNKPLNMDALMAQGKDQAPAFMSLAAGKDFSIDRSKHKDTFVAFFETLQVAGAEFGYRTANEMTTLVSYLVHFGMSESEAYDVAIMQKLLPKLHGSRSKLNKVLPRLIELCQDKYPISLEKLERMKKNAEENGFASYSEA